MAQMHCNVMCMRNNTTLCTAHAPLPPRPAARCCHARRPTVQLERRKLVPQSNMSDSAQWSPRWAQHSGNTAIGTTRHEQSASHGIEDAPAACLACSAVLAACLQQQQPGRGASNWKGYRSVLRKRRQLEPALRGACKCSRQHLKATDQLGIQTHIQGVAGLRASRGCLDQKGRRLHASGLKVVARRPYPEAAAGFSD